MASSRRRQLLARPTDFSRIITVETHYSILMIPIQLYPSLISLFPDVYMGKVCGKQYLE